MPQGKIKSADIVDGVVTGTPITGYVSGAGTVAATDTILQAINKLNGNAGGGGGGGSADFNSIVTFNNEVVISNGNVVSAG